MRLFSSTNSSSSADPIKADPESSAESVHETGSLVETRTKHVGVTSAIFLIFNRMIGTGIFATPSTILGLCGSVGLSLILWVVGGLIAGAGMLVFMEWGSGIPKNGGEKNYLEFVFNKPRFLVTSMYASYVFLLGWAASNSVIFGEYILYAAGVEPTRWNQRGVGWACLTFCFLIHAFALKWGLRLQNILGVFKLVVIAIIIVTGWVALGGGIDIEPTHAFSDAFEGTVGSGYGIVMSIYNVIWAFVGYSNANYALAEAKNPNRVLRVAAPVALISVAVMYLFCNISYFAVVPTTEIMSSGRILAGVFFGKVFGSRGETAMSVFIALSGMGNVLSVIFSQGRIVQELGREGVLPFSRFLSSNKPFDAPAAGLFEHWLVSFVLLFVPPGDAYNFILNLISYPLSVVNVFVALGLIIVYFNRDKYNWHPPIKATLPVTVFFFLASAYLVVAPFIPPTDDQSVYEDLPYYLHCVVGLALFVAGGIYWAIWAKFLPWMGKYTLDTLTILDDKGLTRQKLVKKYADGREVAFNY